MPVSRTVPRHAVDRPELLRRLDAGVQSPLTLLVAPAGSGKTVLLTQWAATASDARVAWLDMAVADDDAVHFARRLTAELRTLDPALAELAAPFGTAGGGLGDGLLETLAGALAEVPGQVVVIFDDLHRVSNTEVVTDLWRLVDLLPPNAHFIFSSRVDLKLGWSRHRLQHGLVEIRQAQLALDADSAGRVLERILRRPVDPQTTASIVERTEGWAAGVQLAGLGLRRTDSGRLVDALAESDRLVSDYLSEEVLDGQTPRRRTALLELSPLEELTPGLVEAVAGISDGVSFLRELEDDSMFVVPVAGRPGRYRFHHLFRDLLRYRLRASDARAEARLLTAAADWHSTQGDSTAAIENLLGARRWDRALDLILARGREVYERGETATVARWLSLVPTEVRARRLEAELLYGILDAMSGHAARAEETIRGVLASPRLTPGIEVAACANLAAGVQFRPHPEIYLAEGERALRLLEVSGPIEKPDLIQLTEPALLRVLAMVSIGRAHFYLGDAQAATEWLQQALDAPGATYGPYRVHILGSLALADAWQGRLVRAAELVDEALELARELQLLTHPAPADAYLARALVAIQRGEPEAGAIALHEGHLRASSNGRVQLMWIAHAQSRLIDPAGTDAAAVPPIGTPPPPCVRDALRVLTGSRPRHAGGATSAGSDTQWSPLVLEEVAGLLAAHDASGARVRLQAVVLPEVLGPSQAVERDILLSWLAEVEGRPDESRRLLIAALAIAENEGLIHPFLRAGGNVEGRLRGLPGPITGFRRTVLEHFAPAIRADAARLVEPLTARELELLAYLPSRLTNAELAARCFVSVNTVKTHMAHIYRKLDASGRDAAIARARELGLLDSSDIARVG